MKKTVLCILLAALLLLSASCAWFEKRELSEGEKNPLTEGLTAAAKEHFQLDLTRIEGATVSATLTVSTDMPAPDLSDHTKPAGMQILLIPEEGVQAKAVASQLFAQCLALQPSGVCAILQKANNELQKSRSFTDFEALYTSETYLRDATEQKELTGQGNAVEGGGSVAVSLGSYTEWIYDTAYHSVKLRLQNVNNTLSLSLSDLPTRLSAPSMGTGNHDATLLYTYRGPYTPYVSLESSDAALSTSSVLPMHDSVASDKTLELYFYADATVNVKILSSDTSIREDWGTWGKRGTILSVYGYPSTYVPPMKITSAGILEPHYASLLPILPDDPAGPTMCNVYSGRYSAGLLDYMLKLQFYDNGTVTLQYNVLYSTDANTEQLEWVRTSEGIVVESEAFGTLTFAEHEDGKLSLVQEDELPPDTDPSPNPDNGTTSGSGTGTSSSSTSSTATTPPSHITLPFLPVD